MDEKFRVSPDATIAMSHHGRDRGELIYIYFCFQTFQYTLNRISPSLQICSDRDFISCFKNTFSASYSPHSQSSV